MSGRFGGNTTTGNLSLNSVDGNVPSEWEMYDLKTDPLEKTNLAYSGYTRTAEQERQFQRLKSRLARVKKYRLKPLPDTPVPLTPMD